ncbi:MAG TPA: tetratricopeptide repeat protein [Terriglobales bacterium]|nr:tetratricopeptide repeat protein [Terriglobales bacterium]
MPTLRPRYVVFGLLFLSCISATLGYGQQAPSAVKTLVVLPFDNRSQAPGLEWVSESFPEVLGQRLSSGSIYVLSRGYRLRAYDRAGIPSMVHPSRATLYRIAEQMDADYAVVGSYTFDGQTFTAFAQLLDMKRRYLASQMTESGPLPKLLDVENALAWDLMQALQPDAAVPRTAFLQAAPQVRLDAFENYIRGLTALGEVDKLQRLRAAIRLNPSYTEAMLELGKTYFEAHDYDAALNWLARVPNTDPLAREANFFLGLSAYYQANFPQAEAAFRFLLESFPLIEVYNNLGVVSARLGKPVALQLFQKAVDADPSDPDYRFNLAIALLRAGDAAGANRQLRECLALSPNDSDAKGLLAAMTARPAVPAGVNPTSAVTSSTAPPKLPLERIKRNYDEAAFRELAIELQNASESRLSKLDPHAHAAYHVQRGRDLLAKGFPVDAEKELREAVELDESSPMAHAALAEALDTNHDMAGARAESSAALKLNPSADVYVVLARVNLRENNLEEAAGLLARALQLDPANAEALALKQKMDGKAANSAQSPPKP